MSLSKNGIGLAAVVSLAGLMMAPVSVTMAQPGGAPTVRPSNNPSRDTLMKMQRPIGIDLNETRLEDVMKYIAETTQAPLESLWKSDKEEGIEKDALITMSVKDMPALMFLEKVLQKVAAESGNDCSWQLTDLGVLQVGTKERLNKFKRIEIYDINDLLFEMPVYDNAPEIDLQQVLQNSGGGGRGRGGGGGGQSPFRDNQQRNREQQKTKEDRANDIVRLITTFVEQPQWSDNGGEGGTIRYYQGHIIVEAPDYMQRGVAGYPWWPQTRAGVVGSKRYVSLNMDTSISKLAGLVPFPVTGTAGGGGGAGPGGGGGGGGSVTPAPGGGGR